MEWSMTWLMLLGMGIFHGINPGMGWLFAVGLGLQEQRRSAVWAALLPLALGHALAVGIAILIFALIGSMIPEGALKWGVAAVLFGFGVYRLFRSRHPRYGGMQMSARQLTVWSFLMASAHGAGLMVLPFVFGVAMMDMDEAAGAHDPGAMHDHGSMAVYTMPDADPVVQTATIESAQAHVGHGTALMAMLPNDPIVGLLATLIHTVGYLLIMGIAAVIVYEKLGLRLLKTAWVNLDVIWASALILTAILTPFI